MEKKAKEEAKLERDSNKEEGKEDKEMTLKEGKSVPTFSKDNKLARTHPAAKKPAGAQMGETVDSSAECDRKWVRDLDPEVGQHGEDRLRLQRPRLTFRYQGRLAARREKGR